MARFRKQYVSFIAGTAQPCAWAEWVRVARLR